MTGNTGNWIISSWQKEHFRILRVRPATQTLAEEDYDVLLSRIEAAYRAEKGEWDAARRDMNDYYAVWVHQIKHLLRS